MKLLLDEVARIEEATRGLLEDELWLAIENARLISSKLEETQILAKLD